MNENKKTDKPDIEKLLFESGKNMALTHAGDKQNPGNVKKILEDGALYADYIVGKMEESLDAPPEIACKAGCFYCCSMQISITPPEALVLGAHVVETYDERRENELLKKIDHNIRLTYKKTRDEKVGNWQKTPCIFLEEGCCSLYAIRPFVCRSWHSLDAAQCVDAYRSKNKEAEIDSLFHRNYVFGTVRNGVQEGCKMLGLQWETEIITSAVKSYLSHPAPLNGWLRGERIFKPG